METETGHHSAAAEFIASLFPPAETCVRNTAVRGGVRVKLRLKSFLYNIL